MSSHYQGSCHCGAIQFSFEGESISQAMRCTCSICSRKGALMTTEAISKEKLIVEADNAAIGLYQFDSKIAKHYFCKTCGIFTHLETLRMPGHCRVNLGCIDELDTAGLKVIVFDGKNLI